MEFIIIKEQLKKIGLTENEIKVYLACFQSGPSLASEIAKKAGTYRTLTYDILNDLIQKGLVSYVIKENRKYYQATSPESLVKYLEEKERNISEQKKKINYVIRELKKIKPLQKNKYSIEAFTGYEGFKTLFEDILKERKEYYLLGYGATGKYLDKPYFINWHKRRIKFKIKRNVIVQERFKKDILKYPEYTKLKCLHDSYELPTSALIYGSKIILFVPLEDDFVGIRIENEKVVKSYMTYFNILWERASVGQ